MVDRGDASQGLADALIISAVSDSSNFWFHCGRCGSLFQARAGEIENRLCPKCGFDPSTGVMDAPETLGPVGTRLPEPGSSSAAADATPAKRTIRKRRNSHLMLKIVGGWSLLLAAIIFGARVMWSDPVSQAPAVSTPAETVTSDENRKLLEDSAGECARTFSGFLSAATPEARNQFVLTPISTASRMARFYSLNPLTSIDPATIGLRHTSVITFPDGKGIETLWQSTGGPAYDALFREERGEWRLDWEHFARYSEFPWSQFLAGDGPSEAEFRLLARERLAKERRNESTISIVLYAPRFGRPDEPGFQSPEFLVSRNKPEGRMLDAAFKLAREGKRVFGSTLPAIDPEEMIRLRVKVKRSEENNERKFEITEIAACHWFSADDPGVTPATPEENR